MWMKRHNGITVPLHQLGNFFNPMLFLQDKKKLLKKILKKPLYLKNKTKTKTPTFSKS